MQGTLPWQPHFGKIGKNLKNGHNICCMPNINGEFGFEIGFQLSPNSSMTLPYTMATNFGTKLLLMSHKVMKGPQYYSEFI